MLINRSKAGILLATLALPAFVFLYLKFFAYNRFDVPYYFPLLNEEGEATVINKDTVFYRFPEFKFEDQNGKMAGVKRGDLNIVYFFFSRCGTICPSLNENINRTNKLLDGLGKYKVYGLSIDPKYDTKEVLFEYKKANNFSYNDWYFLTGDKKEIYDLAVKKYKLPASDAHDYDPNITNIDEAFIHSDKILIIDKEGYCRGIYTGTDRHQVDKLILEMKVLLKQ
jgi:protein SCO1